MKKIFSGEFFFALYLLAGVFKASINFPVDLTALFLVLTSIAVVKRIYKNPEINKINILPVSIFLIFICLVLVSAFYTPNLALAQDKTVKLILLSTPAFVFPFFLFKTKESLTA